MDNPERFLEPIFDPGLRKMWLSELNLSFDITHLCMNTSTNYNLISLLTFGRSDVLIDWSVLNFFFLILDWIFCKDKFDIVA